MRFSKGLWVALVSVFSFGLLSGVAQADQFIWSMANAGNGQLYLINNSTNTVTLIGAIKDPVLGDVGGGWSTVAETPDKTLYFMRRFQNDVYMYKLDATNIQVNGSGVITNVQAIGATGLGGNLDGLTAGPDGNLYLTAYDNTNPSYASNGLFRYNPTNGHLDFVGSFAGGNQFYTDLAFDPITGNLFGTGNGGPQIYELSGLLALTGNNLTGALPYNVVFGACGYDGLAFDRVTGQLFESFDSGGVISVNRNTGACQGVIDNTNVLFGGVIGSDLAVQSDTIPNPTVPEPSSLALFGTGLIGAAGAIRRKIRL